MIRLAVPEDFTFAHVNLCVRPLFYAEPESIMETISAGGADSQQNP